MLFIVSAVIFLIFYILPSADPAVLRAGRNAGPQQIEAIRHSLGLDQPIYTQYFNYMKQVFLHFNFGYSYQYSIPVRQLILNRLPATIWLVVGAVTIWLLLGISIGIISAVRSAIGSGDLSAAEHLACGYRDANGATPEALEAFSWVARGALTMHRIAEAAKLARQTRLVSIRLLGRTKLDAEPHLAAALGTSIEVLAQAMAMQGRRAQAF